MLFIDIISKKLNILVPRLLMEKMSEACRKLGAYPLQSTFIRSGFPKGDSEGGPPHGYAQERKPDGELLIGHVFDRRYVQSEYERAADVSERKAPARNPVDVVGPRHVRQERVVHDVRK